MNPINSFGCLSRSQTLIYLCCPLHFSSSADFKREMKGWCNNNNNNFNYDPLDYVCSLNLFKQVFDIAS